MAGDHVIWWKWIRFFVFKEIIKLLLLWDLAYETLDHDVNYLEGALRITKLSLLPNA